MASKNRWHDTSTKRPPDETRRVRVQPFQAEEAWEEDQQLIAEEPLSITVDGKPYSVIMRTPGEENFHVAGFCLAEGIIDGLDDIADLRYCDEADRQLAAVTLHPERRFLVSAQREEHGRRISAGACGEAFVNTLQQTVHPISKTDELTLTGVRASLDTLFRHQELHAKTRASHAAALFDSTLHMIAMSEDIGRHNALDKVIGKALVAGNLKEVSLAVLSSRLSYEMVQKGARARIPTLIGLSRPSTLAVQLALHLNMTLACDNKKGGLSVYSGFGRIAGAE